MKYLTIPLLLSLALVGCGPVDDGQNSTLEYYVNKDGTECTIDVKKGTTVVAGPFATRDEAKQKKKTDPACAETVAPATPTTPET